MASGLSLHSRVTCAPTCGDVWIVVAAFNEESSLNRTLASLQQYYVNIVVVDDGSRDMTVDIALANDVWVVQHPMNLGQGAALQTGIDFALQRDAQIIVTFDADGQHRAEDINLVVEPIHSGQVDVVLGSRFLGQAEGLPFGRRLLLKVAVLCTRMFSGIQVTDTHNGLRALSRLAAKRIRIREDRMAHASELLHQIGQLRLRYCERPVTIRYTPETLAKGQSSWNAFAVASQFILGQLVK